MNSHQRRKAMRSQHMLLPLGKEIDLRCLLGRTVYALGEYQRYTPIHPEWDHQGASARVGRHCEPLRVTLDVIMPDGEELSINTSTAGLRLKNPTDRAERPWWANLRRAGL